MYFSYKCYNTNGRRVITTTDEKGGKKTSEPNQSASNQNKLRRRLRKHGTERKQ